MTEKEYDEIAQWLSDYITKEIFGDEYIMDGETFELMKEKCEAEAREDKEMTSE